MWPGQEGGIRGHWKGRVPCGVLVEVHMWAKWAAWVALSPEQQHSYGLWPGGPLQVGKRCLKGKETTVTPEDVILVNPFLSPDSHFLSEQYWVKGIGITQKHCIFWKARYLVGTGTWNKTWNFSPFSPRQHPPNFSSFVKSRIKCHFFGKTLEWLLFL